MLYDKVFFVEFPFIFDDWIVVSHLNNAERPPRCWHSTAENALHDCVSASFLFLKFFFFFFVRLFNNCKFHRRQRRAISYMTVHTIQPQIPSAAQHRVPCWVCNNKRIIDVGQTINTNLPWTVEIYWELCARSHTKCNNTIKTNLKINGNSQKTLHPLHIVSAMSNERWATSIDILSYASNFKHWANIINPC